MEHLRDLIQYLSEDAERFAFFVLAGLSLFELFVRISPTKRPETATERIGKIFKVIFDLLRVPNVKRVEGSLKPKGQHDRDCQ